MRKVPSLYQEGQNDTYQPRDGIYIANLTKNNPYLPLVSLYRYMFSQFATLKSLKPFSFVLSLPLIYHSLRCYISKKKKKRCYISPKFELLITEFLPCICALHKLINCFFLVNLTFVSLIFRALVTELEKGKDFPPSPTVCIYVCMYVCMW